MNRVRPGWNILIFLIIMTMITLLATNCFKVATHFLMSSRMRYRYHQEVRLLEGLLIYGIHLCHENGAELFSWGMQESRIMSISFNSWPSVGDIYKGFVIISSDKGVLSLRARLSRDNLEIMAGSCELVALDPRNIKYGIRVINWHIGKDM